MERREKDKQARAMMAQTSSLKPEALFSEPFRVSANCLIVG